MLARPARTGILDFEIFPVPMPLSRKDLVFLDVETHSLAEPLIIQLAYKREGGSPVTSYFSTGGAKIDLKAMAVHHITEETVAGKPPFRGSPEAAEIGRILSSGVLVAHNATFDAGALRAHGVAVPNVICTLRLSRHLHPEAEQHKLQYLRYWFAVKPAGEVRAHDAEGDILVLEAVFARLYEDMAASLPGASESEVLEAMAEVSSHPSVLATCTFGKHKGTPWAQVPADYLKWALEKSDFDDENVLYTCKFYLERAGERYSPKQGAQSYVCDYPMPKILPAGVAALPAEQETLPGMPAPAFKRKA